MPMQPMAPAGMLDERSQFWEILALHENGEITDEEATKKLMGLYQASVAGQLRAIGETKPSLLASVIKRLSSELGVISETYDAGLEVATERALAAESKLDISSFRMKSKRPDILRREHEIVGALVRDDNMRPFVLSELVEMAREYEPKIMDAAVTANLDRLCKLGVINRPRKGYYAANENSKGYLAELNIEMDARGLSR
ncbi:MAG: hypothetical protein AAGD43_35810 [Pseudomonadota bacterium]